MMRVIGGSARGRRLKTPRGRGTRPTSDRVREAMFSSLRDRIPGAVVLDLFAGTGALGIEALSRGAAAATFVENDAEALGVLAGNLRAAGLTDRGSIKSAAASAFVRRPTGGPFTVVFCDPPYDVAFAAVLGLVAQLDDAEALARAATVVVERDRRDPALVDVQDPQGVLAVDRQRSYGDTVLVYLRTKDA
ncbi:MAG: 16S rRNA (guanine(966)-N(2))-methyltransferase RsmD [Nitriliruptorales bacterium]|nr:16S rRNA (guanine(966)-N(2))-methyltransferase RsmD [Nitriliruptorales bacterium]